MILQAFTFRDAKKVHRAAGILAHEFAYPLGRQRSAGVITAWFRVAAFGTESVLCLSSVVHEIHGSVRAGHTAPSSLRMACAMRAGGFRVHANRERRNHAPSMMYYMKAEYPMGANGFNILKKRDLAFLRNDLRGLAVRTLGLVATIRACTDARDGVFCFFLLQR
jgi:hypothetical protein